MCEHEHFMQRAQFSPGVGHSRKKKLHQSIPNGQSYMVKDLQLSMKKKHGYTWLSSHKNIASTLPDQVTF